MAIYTGNLASLELDRENWPQAEALAQEALLLSEQVGRQELIANNCGGIAMALVRQGKASEALPYAQRAMEIFINLGSPKLKYALATLAGCEKQ